MTLIRARCDDTDCDKGLLATYLNKLSSTMFRKKSRVNLRRAINNYDKYRSVAVHFTAKHSNEDVTGVVITETGNSDLYKIARPPPLTVNRGLSVYVYPGGEAKFRL